MKNTPTDICDDVLINLRKIIRSMDLHSRKLRREHDLTSPQLVLLREIVRNERIAMGALARQVSLSSATVTGIVDRLEERGLVTRSRTGTDRRQILLASTPEGQRVMAQAPTLFQERFVDALSGLRQWEQAQILASLARLAEMMERDGLPPAAAAPPPLPEGGVAEAPDGFLASCQMLLDGPPSEVAGAGATPAPPAEVALTLIRPPGTLPPTLPIEALAAFLHASMQPYEDTPEDIRRGLEYALGIGASPGGFILLAWEGEVLVGALVMLHTGMSGYIPENLLLFLAVAPDHRGRGIGARLTREAQDQCRGRIKLHVEYENPARRLYARLGFSSKYAEMRWPDESRYHQS